MAESVSFSKRKGHFVRRQLDYSPPQLSGRLHFRTLLIIPVVSKVMMPAVDSLGPNIDDGLDGPACPVRLFGLFHEPFPQDGCQGGAVARVLAKQAGHQVAEVVGVHRRKRGIGTPQDFEHQVFHAP